MFLFCPQFVYVSKCFLLDLVSPRQLTALFALLQSSLQLIYSAQFLWSFTSQIHQFQSKRYSFVFTLFHVYHVHCTEITKSLLTRGMFILTIIRPTKRASSSIWHL